MAGAKRKRSGSDTKQTKQPKQDGQTAVSKDINVPIDEGFGDRGELHFRASYCTSSFKPLYGH